MTSSYSNDDFADGVGYGRGMDLNQRIYLARESAKLTQEQLANAVGKTRGAVAQWESGDVRPRHATLVAIAKATGKNITWLESGVDDDVAGLEVIGEVAAGHWKEGSVGFKRYGQPVSPHPDFPPQAQRLYRVAGNSLNKKVADGEYLHTLDIHLSGVAFQNGDLVVVRRMNHGLTEYTAKTAIRENGHWILRPESTEPEFQEDIILKDDGSEIEITDIVLAKWSPLGRFSR